MSDKDLRLATLLCTSGLVHADKRELCTEIITNFRQVEEKIEQARSK